MLITTFLSSCLYTASSASPSPPPQTPGPSPSHCAHCLSQSAVSQHSQSSLVSPPSDFQSHFLQ